MGLGKSLQALITISLVHSELKAEREENGAEINQNTPKSSEHRNVNKEKSAGKLKNSRGNSKKEIRDDEKMSEKCGSVLHGEKTLGRSLVICPASLTLHWKEEIIKFFPFGDLLIPELYGSSDGVDVKKKINVSDRRIDKNKNKNKNKNENKNETESEKGTDSGVGVVEIASYDSVRRNKNNYFTNQVRIFTPL